MQNSLLLQPIGIILSPFKELEDMPIQSVGAKSAQGKVIVEERFTEGLSDLEGFSHIYLVYHFHRANRTELRVIPYMDTVERGVFSTRSPLRPSHLGISIVELLSVTGNVLAIRGVDVLDETPLIDIKPYIPQFDCREDATYGWMKACRSDVERRRSDNRFT